MDYMSLGNARIRDKRTGKKISIFQRVEELKRDIKAMLPEVEPSSYIKMLSRIRREHDGILWKGKVGNVRKLPVELRLRDKLTFNEKIVYDYLLKNQLCPGTVYRWFIATRLPEDIKEKLAKNMIGQAQAMKIACNRKKVRMSNLGLIVIEELRTIVGGL
jgi:hypothetical protein